MPAPLAAGGKICVSGPTADLIGCLDRVGLAEASNDIKTKVSLGMTAIEAAYETKTKYSDGETKAKIDACVASSKLSSVEPKKQKASKAYADMAGVWGAADGTRIIAIYSDGDVFEVQQSTCNLGHSEGRIVQDENGRFLAKGNLKVSFLSLDAEGVLHVSALQNNLGGKQVLMRHWGECILPVEKPAE
jgi:hypothetical protein